MNCVISVCNPKDLNALAEICKKMEVPLNVVFMGRGTAVKSMLDILGIESNEKRVVLSVANNDKTDELIKEQKQKLYVGVPGHGLVVAVPIKSVGGGKTVDFLNGGKPEGKTNAGNKFYYELIIAVANEGRTDMVMNAARAAGAAGGTVLHGKGTGSEKEEMFYNFSIVQEKEVVMIVAKSGQKKEIMKSILEKAGPGTEAGSIVFSLPISEAAGFGMFEE